MTKENYTEIALVVDRSGSMSSCWKDTIGGIKEFIKSQKEVPGEAKISITFFDTYYDIPINGIDLNDEQLTEQNLSSLLDKFGPRGSTALLDAIGNTINTVGTRLSSMDEQDRPSKVIVCIVTDGGENASCEFTHTKIREMITHQTDTYAWDFNYLGANQDAFLVGNAIGIYAENISNFDTNTSDAVFRGCSVKSTDVRCRRSVATLSSYYASSGGK